MMRILNSPPFPLLFGREGVAPGTNNTFFCICSSLPKRGLAESKTKRGEFKFFVLLLILSLKVLPLQAQKGLNLSLHTGNVLKINPIYPEVTQPLVFGEISYQLPYQADRHWQKLNQNLRISFTTHLLSLGNPEVLGIGIGETVDLNVWLFSLFQQKMSVSLRYGSGLGWISKPFDRTSNTANNAIGTHINNLTRIALRANFSTSKSYQPFVQFSYTHFSNSRVRVPNLGVNIPAIGIGVRWKEPDEETYYPAAKFCFTDRHRFLSLRLSMGGTSATAPNGPIYPVYLGAIAYNHTTQNLRFRWKVGVESFVSYASYANLRDYDQPFPQTAWNATGIIVFTGGEFLLGRFSSVAHLGPYIKHAFQMKYALYTKLGVKYHLRDQHTSPRHQPFIGIYMHAHSGESDFVEMGLGWNF